MLYCCHCNNNNYYYYHYHYHYYYDRSRTNGRRRLGATVWAPGQIGAAVSALDVSALDNKARGRRNYTRPDRPCNCGHVSRNRD